MMRNFLAKLGHRKTPECVDRAAPGTPDQNGAAAARLFDEGRQYRAVGDFARAEHSLKQALELKHDFGEAHLALGDVMTASGRLEDAIDSYQLAVHFSPGLAAAHLALATALLGRQGHDEAEAACRTALTLDGRSTAAWYCLGNVLKARGDLEQSASAYRAAAEGAPADINALHQLAFVEFRLGRYDDAFRDFGALLTASPDSPMAHHNFGLLLLETGHPEEALASFQRALHLQPGTPETMACIAHALRDLGRLDEAIAAYRDVLAKHGGFGDALANCSLALLMRGDYAAGWMQYEQRFVASGKRARSTGVPVWQGESLAGRRIAVLSEQGIGDEIMFASCLPDLLAAAGHVVIECDPRLQDIFSRSFTQATVRCRDGEGAAQGNSAARPDCEISIGSLPLHFRSARESFPQKAGYLLADPDKVTSWRDSFGASGVRRRIGVAWRGGTLRNRQYLRSLDLAEMLPVLRQPGCEFVSLQYGDCRGELHAIHEQGGIVVRDLARDVGMDIDELAAAIEVLDLIITVDNTIAHLSGALGKPVWILVPFSAEWRYGRDRENMDWYPSARFFRQPAPRDWAAVVERVAHCLGRVA
jgi:tetratricopeptide (TPR) repeat protein